MHLGTPKYSIHICMAKRGVEFARGPATCNRRHPYDSDARVLPVDPARRETHESTPHRGDSAESGRHWMNTPSFVILPPYLTTDRVPHLLWSRLSCDGPSNDHHGHPNRSRRLYPAQPPSIGSGAQPGSSTGIADALSSARRASRSVFSDHDGRDPRAAAEYVSHEQPAHSRGIRYRLGRHGSGDRQYRLCRRLPPLFRCCPWAARPWWSAAADMSCAWKRLGAASSRGMSCAKRWRKPDASKPSRWSMRKHLPASASRLTE